MERIVYDRMAEHDSVHWWYRARRKVLASLIRTRVCLPAGAKILEIGCGTGHNLAMLGSFGTVDAIEIDDAARAMASERLGREVKASPLPELTGIPHGAYDMVALLDVLEHIEDDVAPLVSIARLLKPGGRILIAVPAHPWLWSAHDIANHHFRRYTAASLTSAVEAAGLKIDHLGSINSLLFPVAVFVRFLKRAIRSTESDDELPSRPMNWLFEKIFAFEAHLVGRFALPIGVSLVAVVSP